jgi:glucose/arabinose dehydrogenase
MSLRANAFLATGALLLLASCGGGGGGSGGGGGGGTANAPPTITSPAAATVAENASGTIYQAAATDPDGNSVTFSISGTDAARFAITPGGALSFIAAPDFEAPADAGANNVYDLVLTASDGSLSSQIALAVTVTNQPDAAAVRRLATGYDQPSDIEAIPGGTSLFVAERTGRIYLVDGTQQAESKGTLFMTVGNVGSFPGFDAFGGVSSIVPAPDYATSGRFYVAVVDPAGFLEIRRYARANATTGDPASADVILRIQVFPRNLSNNNAELVFGPDGMLYVLTGEGGDSGAPQDTTRLLGKVLRIDVSQDSFPADAARDYAIPSDNPLLNGVRNEVYAYGLYGPVEAHFSGADLLFDDSQGQNFGEINLLRPQDKGANYGYPLDPASPPPGVTRPVIRTQFPRAGFVYRGLDLSLRETYFYAKNFGGIYGVPASQLVQGNFVQDGPPRPALNPQPLLAPNIISFAEDSKGDLYYVTLGEGNLYKIEAR